MFTLTSNNIIPIEAWVSTPSKSPLEDTFDIFVEELGRLQSRYNLRNALCPDNFRGNNFTNELLLKIVEFSRTATRKLTMDSPNTVPTVAAPTVTYYTYMELYKKVFSASFIERIRKRYEEIKSKAVGRRKDRLEESGVKIKGVPLRSFHILDDSADSSKAFRITVNYIESETGSSIAWNHLSTYSSARSLYDRTEHVKDPSHWIKGVDGDDVNIANLRAWKNKIITVLKNVDVIVVNAVSNGSADESTDNTACAIAFSLMNLNSSGTAIISFAISSLVHSSTVSLVHLFARCFERVQVIHTIADDRLFLCGVEYNGLVISRNYAHLITACQTRASIFSAEYMNGPEFTETVERLLNIIRAASSWRLAQYQKMLSIYEKLSGSLVGKMLNSHIDKTLQEYYPDESKHWRDNFGM